MPPIMRNRYSTYFVPLFILIAVFVIFHADVIFGAKTYTNLWIFKNHLPFKNLFPQIYNLLNQSSDPTTHYLPNKFFIMDALRKGIAPLWNPYIFCGFPFYANGSAAPFSPLNLLLLKFSLFETYAIQLLFVFLAGGTTFFFLLNRCFQLGSFASLCGALIYIFCPFLMENIDFDTLLEFLWIFPIIIFLLENGFKKRSPSTFIALGFLLALTSYMAHMHVVLNALLLTGLYSLLKLWPLKRREKIRVLLYLFLSVLIFLGLSAIQLIPFLEFLSQSQRNIPSAESSRYSIPSDPWTSIYPILLKIPRIHQIIELISKGKIELVGRGIYIGIFPFLSGLALIMLFLRKKMENRWVVFVVIFVFYYVSRILPIDKLFPFYNLWMPRFWMLFIFSAAILSAVTIQMLFDKDLNLIPILIRITKVILYFFILPITLFSVIISILLTQFREKLSVIITEQAADHSQNPLFENRLHEFLNHLDQLVSITSPFILIPFISAILFIFIFHGFKKLDNSWKFNYLSIPLLSLLLFDLLSYGYLFRSKPVPIQNLLSTNRLLSFLQKDRDLYRIATIQDPQFPMVFKPNLGTLYGLYDIGGQESVINRQYLEFAKTVLQNRPYTPLPHSEGILTFEQLNLKMAGLLNVKYILYAENDTPQKGLEPVLRSDGIKLYRNPYFLPRAFLVDLDLSRNASALSGSVEILRYEPNHIDIDVQSPQNAYLILSDTYSSDWHASVDGRKTDVLMAYGVIRSVFIPKGNHHVKYEYRPKSLKWGFMITVVTLLGLLFFLFFGCLSKWFNIKNSCENAQ